MSALIQEKLASPIFSDFDGTLTFQGGKLGEEFWQVLKLVQQKNHQLVIVSGRSASWGHFLLTHFPVKFAIMENGGVLLEKKGKRFIQTDALTDELELERLVEVEKKLLDQFPNAPMAYDNLGRIADRALEFEEDSEAALLGEIEDFFRLEKVHFVRSNVHLNYWTAPFSKYSGVTHFLERNFDSDFKSADAPFFGDSLNDESMFEHYGHTVGVSNIATILERLRYRPKVILEGEGNRGPLGVLNYLENFF